MSCRLLSSGLWLILPSCGSRLDVFRLVRYFLVLGNILRGWRGLTFI